MFSSICAIRDVDVLERLVMSGAAAAASAQICSEVAHPTRFERVTFAFGGQLFDTEALEHVGTIRHQICRDGSRVAALFIWKRLLSY